MNFYNIVPEKDIKKWTNTVLRGEYRKIETRLISCLKKKERLHKNANNVYKKYKDKVKQLEADKQEAEQLIGELNDKIIVLEDALG